MSLRTIQVFLVVFLGLGFLNGCFVERQGPPRGPSTVIGEEDALPDEEEEHEEEAIEPTTDDHIVVTFPQQGQTVTAPLTVTGEARGGWYFEATFPVRLVDAQGNEVAVGYAEAQDDWMQVGFVPFKAVLERFKSGVSEDGTLILEKANASGLPEHADQLEIPVKIHRGETSIVRVYFPNSVKDPDFMDCAKVFVVERSIPKTQGIARAALEELLKGPTASEKAEGYITSLNEGVKIQRLVVENGVAKVDFSEELDYQVGGSCRIQSIYSQIETTLKQFPTVREVEISIDGETEEILQP